MSNQRKTQKTSNYFPKISSIIGWFTNAKNSFFVLLYLIKSHSSFISIRYQVVAFLTHSMVYPVSRIIFGRRKTINIYLRFLNAHRSIIFPLPPPLKSKIAMRHIDPELFNEIYLENIYFHEIIKEGMNIVDIGANIGAYTVLAAEKVGENGKVIAVEPEPQNYNQLLENMRLNNFKNVIPQNIALTDHQGQEKLYLSFSPGSHSLFLPENKNSYIEISVKTVDSLLEELNLKKVDVIKIDTEGAEIPILKGAEKTLKANPNIKIIVAAEHYLSEIEEVCQFLNKRGFKTKVSYGSTVMTI